MSRLSTGILLIACLYSERAVANEFNYQDIIVGERALGMGGAYAALSDDPTGSYYNPAGLATALSSSISANLNVYGFEKREIENGYTTFLGSANLNSETMPTVPTTFGIMRKLGPRLYEDGPKQHAIAFSMLVPSNVDYALSGDIESTSEDDFLGEIMDTNSFEVSHQYRTLWAGPSYAYLINSEWAVGLSIFGTVTTIKRRYSVTDFSDTKDDTDFGYVEWGESSMDLTHYGLTFRAGGMYQPSDNWRIGLTFGSPWISVYGEGSQKVKIATGRYFGDGFDFVEINSNKYGLDDVTYLEPFEIRLGGAYLYKNLTLALDVSYHHSLEYRPYKDPESDTEENAYIFLDPFLLESQIKRNPVFNANIGWEYVIDDEWPLRNGYYTNFSSALDLGRTNTPSPTQIDAFGTTLSIGYIRKGYNINIGVQSSIGLGHAHKFDPAGQKYAYEPTEATEYLVYFFISGAQKAVAQTVKDIMKKEQSELEEDGPDAAEDDSEKAGVEGDSTEKPEDKETEQTSGDAI